MKQSTFLNTKQVWLIATTLSTLATGVAALPTMEGRALCTSYKQIYSGDRTVTGHGTETIIVSELGRLGLGRVYLPGPGLVNAEDAATICKAACTAGVNGQNCLSTTVYHKCSSAGGDPFIPCGADGADPSTGGFWYCDFYTEKLTAKDYATSGSNHSGNIRSSKGFVQSC